MLKVVFNFNIKYFYFNLLLGSLGSLKGWDPLRWKIVSKNLRFAVKNGHNMEEGQMDWRNNV